MLAELHVTQAQEATPVTMKLIGRDHYEFTGADESLVKAAADTWAKDRYGSYVSAVEKRSDGTFRITARDYGCD